MINGASDLITSGDGDCLFLASKGRNQFLMHKEMLLGSFWQFQARINKVGDYIIIFKMILVLKRSGETLLVDMSLTLSKRMLSINNPS